MKILPCTLMVLAATLGLSAQQQNAQIKGVISENGQKPVIAIPDFRATGGAVSFMPAFNDTVRKDIEGSGALTFASKSFFPLQVPQQPSDLTAGAATPGQAAPGQPARAMQGFNLAEWGNPPISANYLGIGYAAEQNSRFVLFGWLYDVSQAANLQGAQVFGKIYTGDLNQEGAMAVAHQYAADILARFGVKTLIGTRIIFVSSRTGAKEIWSMNWDGTAEKALTHFGSISSFPSVSPDGRRVAFTSWLRGLPRIIMFSLETGRELAFYNQNASMNCCLSFTPDGKQVVFSSTAAGGPAQLYGANIDGSGLHRLASSRGIDTEPKINPKTGTDLVFVSGRGGGNPQVYLMSQGGDAERLTDGSGDAVNPSWSPDGTKIAFAWTRGYEPGNFNIFVMDVASRKLVQLTNNEGRNENPSWAPDGIHIVYANKRGSNSQIWTMLADGTQKKQVTNSGSNEKPVWAASVQ
jgi:TolB protein